MKIKLIFITLITLIVFVSCTKNKAEVINEGEKNSVSSVKIEKIQNILYKDYIEISARPEGINDVMLTSEVSGRVTVVNKNIGDWVEKGEEIGAIENEDYRIRLEQAKASLMAAEAGMDAAEAELKSSEELYTKKSLSEVQILKARSAYKNAKAGLNSAQASVEQNKRSYDNTRMVSPVSGYISEIFLKAGENISVSKPICSIVNTKKMKIVAGLGEKDISKVREGNEVFISHDNLTDPLIGKVSGKGYKPSSGATTYPVEIIFENKGEKILPGMIVQCRILSKSVKDAVVIKTGYILKDGGNKFVFLEENGTAVKRFIETGYKSGDNIIVTEGLSAGENLIISGIENLSAGSTVKIQ